MHVNPEPQPGDHSPWGTIDSTENIHPGITRIHTPWHGGYKLSPNLNALIHPALREPDGYYEEDTEEAVIRLHFPAETAHPNQSTQENYTNARKKIREWYPAAYDATTIHPTAHNPAHHCGTNQTPPALAGLAWLGFSGSEMRAASTVDGGAGDER